MARRRPVELSGKTPWHVWELYCDHIELGLSHHHFLLVAFFLAGVKSSGRECFPGIHGTREGGQRQILVVIASRGLVLASAIGATLAQRRLMWG